MKKSVLIFASFLIIFVIVGCDGSGTAEIPVLTVTPSLTAAITPTQTLRPTRTPIPTPAPIFITIGSPFPSEWGMPRIWSNDSFNAPWDRSKLDMHHGHMDVAVPTGYSHHDGFNLDNHIGDVVAPVSGNVVPYEDNSTGFHIFLPENTYLDGMLEALKFAGIEQPSLKKISNLRIDIGHVANVKSGYAEKGEIIAEIVPKGFNYQAQYSESGVAFQVFLLYSGVEYNLSPTLFSLDEQWICYPISYFDCQPESYDYAP